MTKKNIILQKHKTTLCTVQDYINEKLDPKKVNILNQRKADYKDVPSITDILCGLGITEDEYYNALSISSDEYFQIYLQREPNACFFILLKKWLHGKQILTYSHFLIITKQSHTCVLTFQKQKMRKKMKAIAKAYTTKRECSVQEAVYLIMPELCLKLCS